MTMQSQGGGPMSPSTSSSSLADVVDTILDKGIVIDAYVGVSLIGIQLLTIDARVTIASVDTYLKFAERANRLDLSEKQGKDLGDVVGAATGGAGQKAGQKMVESAAKGGLDAAGEALGNLADPLAGRQGSQQGRNS